MYAIRIVSESRPFGAAIAASLLFADSTHSRRILVLEAGPFALPEHNQNMTYQGGTPDFRKPWDSHPALAYPGLLFAVGGRSLAWGGWSPQMLAAEISSWPASVAADLVNKYFEISSDQIGATDSNDFIFGRLHDALRLQLFQAMKTAANVPAAMPLATLPDHPAVRYSNQSATLAAAAGAAGGTVTTVPPPPVAPDSQLREWLGFDPSDTTPRADLLNLSRPRPFSTKFRERAATSATNTWLLCFQTRSANRNEFLQWSWQVMSSCKSKRLENSWP